MQLQKDTQVELLIDNALIRERNQLVLVGSLLVFVSIMGIAFLFWYKDSIPRHWSIGLGVGGFAIGAGIIHNAIKSYSINKKKYFSLLNERNDEVVWVYYRKQESLPFGIKVLSISTLYICLRSGEKMAILIPEKDILVVVDELRWRLFYTTFGYSVFKEQLYNISPNLLVKE